VTGVWPVAATGAQADTYGFLLGEWSIRRTCQDHRRGETAVFTGSVTVTARGDARSGEAEYREVGELTLGAFRGSAQRRLAYVRRRDGSVAIEFEDGRGFVDCDLRHGECLATHVCGDDHYELGWYVGAPLDGARVLQERWRVRGPHKDYDAAAVLLRALPFRPSGPRATHVA
jgi:Family of unknown function (DUF6314)